MELYDKYNNGLLDKKDFCEVINKVQPSKEYNDDDIMRFLRICSLVSDNNKAKYPEFLDLIFYNSFSDEFTKLLNCLKNLMEKYDNDVNLLFSVISKKNILTIKTNENFSLDLDTIFKFFNSFDNFSKNIITKLDIDKDGKVGKNDILSVLNRYNKTSFFKYENNGIIVL